MRLVTTEEWQQFVENVKEKANQMSPDSMDYDMIWFFCHQIKNGQIPINKMIRDYGETYFRELIESCKSWSDESTTQNIV